MEEQSRRLFGTMPDGTQVEEITLRSGGLTAGILTYGGAVRTLTVPGRSGAPVDVALGFDSLEDYRRQDKYLGALVGRVANRIGGAAFELNGKSYPLAANSGPNCLHGGVRGFNQAVWQAREVDGALVLTHVSPDGDEGFPGALEVRVTYSLTADGVLRLDYWAKSDADTLCNLTNHSYFNLLGHDAGTLAGQQVEIFADAITQTDENSTPTGALLPVEGTPFDLRRPRDFLEGLAMDHPQLALGNGYDHNFVLHTAPISPLSLAARVSGGGLVLECLTTQPGLQLYTANYLDSTPGKGGTAYGPRSAFCLETQNWPDAVHHASFPSPVLRAGEVYRHRTVYRVGMCPPLP